MAATIELTERVDLTALAAVYRRVHAADLHLVDHSDPSVEDRLRWTAEAPGFRAALGHVDGELVGAVLGCPLPPDTQWWRDIGEKEWEGRTFAVCEAFVLPEVRKHWIGSRMTEALLSACTEERVTLAVAETNTRVWHALQRRGFARVGDLEPFPGWRPHRMLVSPLPLGASR